MSGVKLFCIKVPNLFKKKPRKLYFMPALSHAWNEDIRNSVNVFSSGINGCDKESNSKCSSKHWGEIIQLYQWEMWQTIVINVQLEYPDCWQVKSVEGNSPCNIQSATDV